MRRNNMKCPKCKHLKSSVTQSLKETGSSRVVRKRLCDMCGFVFQTIETPNENFNPPTSTAPKEEPKEEEPKKETPKEEVEAVEVQEEEKQEKQTTAKKSSSSRRKRSSTSNKEA